MAGFSTLRFRRSEDRKTAAQSGVISFNTRTGAVVPTTGDYAVAQVTGAAPLASPALTGVPTAPTAAPGTNSAQVATTAYVLTNQASAGVSSFNGRAGTVVPVSGDYTAAQVTGAAPLASPALTGTPTAPTAAPGTNTTQIASTAFVLANGGAAQSTTIVQPDYVVNTGTASQALTANDLYVARLLLPASATLTGLQVGGGGGGSFIASLYNISGTRVAVSNSTALSGAAVGRVPFTGTYAAAAGFYFAGVQTNIGSISVANTFVPSVEIALGSFVSPASITPPTLPSATLIPVLSTY